MKFNDKKAVEAALLIISILKDAESKGITMTQGDLLRRLGFPEEEACRVDDEPCQLTEYFYQHEEQVLEELRSKLATVH